MLEALSDIDPVKARGILADIAIRAGAPRLEGRREDSLDKDPLVAEIVADLRRELGINPVDDSRQARDRIAVAAGVAGYKLSLASVDRAATKSRLGDKGLLHPSDFKVSWGDAVDVSNSAFGVRMTQAIEVVLSPDEYQHLVSEEEMVKTSLFVKTVKPKKGGFASTVLVIGVRDGASISIQCALRAFHDSIDLSSAVEPLDVLRAFCDVYCHEITIGDKTGNLISNSLAEQVDEGNVMAAWRNTAPIFLHILQRHVPESDKFFVSLGFGLNMDLIYEDLRRHGIATPPPIGPFRAADGSIPAFMRVVVKSMAISSPILANGKWTVTSN